MNYYEAKQALRSHNPQGFMGVDFYLRTQGEVPIHEIYDIHSLILEDISKNGSPSAKERLNRAIENGTVEYYKGQVDFFDFNYDLSSFMPMAQRSHWAMQIAFPEIYEKHFGGPVDPDDPPFAELARQTEEWRKTFDPNKPPRRGPGRPRKESVPKVLDTAFAAWVAACQQYKADLSASWARCVDTRTRCKDMIAKGEEWHKNEIARLKTERQNVVIQTQDEPNEEMGRLKAREAEILRERQKLEEQLAQLRNQMEQSGNDAVKRIDAEIENTHRVFEDGVAKFKAEIALALTSHQDLKARGKPKREDFKSGLQS